MSDANWPHVKAYPDYEQWVKDQGYMAVGVEGVKHDQDKPDLSLLPREFIEEVARAFMHGEKKYGRHNFKAGMDWHRPLAAAMRHLAAFNAGEDTDAESGCNHLGNAGAAIGMLLYYVKNKVGNDTRYKP